MIKQITYEGTKQNQFMFTSEVDQITLGSVDTDELDAQVQINFIAPKNVLNYNTFVIRSEQQDFEQMNCKVKFKGDPDGNLVLVVKLMIETLDNFDFHVGFDEQVLQYQNKIRLKWNNPFSFQTNDYFYSKIIGCQQNVVYQSQHFDVIENGEIVSGYEYIEFPFKMFLGFARMLNVACFYLNEANYFEKGKKQFILLKTPYNFQPGCNRVVVYDQSVTFTTNTLKQGFSVIFYDENYVELPLEDDLYIIDLFIQKSKRRVQIEQQTLDYKMKKEQQEQQIQEYLAQKEAENKQKVDEFVKQTQNEEIQEFNEKVLNIKVLHQKILKQIGFYKQMAKLQKDKKFDQQWNKDVLNVITKLNEFNTKINEHYGYIKQQKQQIYKIAKYNNPEQVQQLIQQLTVEQIESIHDSDIDQFEEFLQGALDAIEEKTLQINDQLDLSKPVMNEGENQKVKLEKRMRNQIITEMQSSKIFDFKDLEHRFDEDMKEINEAKVKIIDEDEIIKEQFEDGKKFIREQLDMANRSDEYEDVVQRYYTNFQDMINKKLVNKKFKVEELNNVALYGAFGMKNQEYEEMLKNIKNDKDENLFDVLGYI